jgi:hypothetical protein
MQWETFGTVFPRYSPVAAVDVACCAAALDGQMFGAVTTVIHRRVAMVRCSRWLLGTLYLAVVMSSRSSIS